MSFSYMYQGKRLPIDLDQLGQIELDTSEVDPQYHHFEGNADTVRHIRLESEGVQEQVGIVTT